MASSDVEPITQFEWTHSGGPSTALISTLSEVLEDNILDVPPLYSAVDPDSLDQLFAPTRTPPTRLDGSVKFEYQGYQVVINANGRGYIYDPQ